MYRLELYLHVRRARMSDGMGVWEASRVFGLRRDAVPRMLEYAATPGCRRRSPSHRFLDSAENPSTQSSSRIDAAVI